MEEVTLEQLSLKALPPAALLVGCRLLGLFIAAPFFRSRMLPWRLKIAVVAVLSLGVLVSPTLQESMAGLPAGVIENLGNPAHGWLTPKLTCLGLNYSMGSLLFYLLHSRPLEPCPPDYEDGQGPTRSTA